MITISQIIHRITSISAKHPLIIIALITLLTYANALPNDFVFDDYSFLFNWPTITQPLHNLSLLLTGDIPYGHTGVYRPVRSLIYSFSLSLFHHQPFGYHLQAVLIHLSISLLLYSISKHLTKNKPVSFWVSLIFAVHPLHTEATSWITASFDTTGLLLLFISFYLYLQHRHTKSPQPLLRQLSLLLAFVASFIYEITLIYPLLLFVYEYLLVKKAPIISTINRIKPYFFGPTTYLILKFMVLNLENRAHHYIANSPTITALTMLVAHAKYYFITLFPSPPNINHSITHGITNFYFDEIYPGKPMSFPSPTSPSVLFSLLFLIFLVSVIIKFHKQKPLLCFGLLWMTISLLPVMQIAPTINLFAERYAYLASFGLLLSLVWSLHHLLHTKPVLFHVILVLYTCLCIPLSIRRNTQWHNHLSFWTASLRQSPNSSIITNQMASTYWEMGDLDTARLYALKAVELNPGNAVTLYNLAVAYFHQENFPAALELVDRAINVSPIYANSYILKADILRLQHQPGQAIPFYQRALELNRFAFPAYINLSSCYQLSNQTDNAVSILQKALGLAPQNPDLYLALGAIYHQQNLFDQALKTYSQGLIYDPTHSGLQQALSRAQNQEPWSQ